MNNIKSIVFLAALALTTFLSSCQSSKVKSKESKVASNSVNGFEIDLSKPIWADEFDKDGKPNAEIWSYDLGGNGWGNVELQNYTNDIKNAEVKNGKLHIKAIKEKTGENAYSSARLVTKNKKDILYGRVEVKAKLPVGIGTWPAIWMLGTDNSYGESYWPDNGEIDIMEHVGYDQDVVHGNVHTKAFNHVIGTNKGNKITVLNASEKFNIYAINWYPDSIIFEINGLVYFKFEKTKGYEWQQWPFDKKQHLLLNLAVGGAWGGQKGVDDAIFPQEMIIDYVRVYGLKSK